MQIPSLKYFDIPGIDGWKTLIGGWGLTAIGGAMVLAKLAALVLLIGQCLAGQATFDMCVEQIPVLLAGFLSSFAGISVLGIGHKAQWIIELLEQGKAIAGGSDA